MSPGREGLEARKVALDVCLVEAHIARARHGALHDCLQRVCQPPLLSLQLLCPLCIHIQSHACHSGVQPKAGQSSLIWPFGVRVRCGQNGLCDLHDHAMCHLFFRSQSEQSYRMRIVRGLSRQGSSCQLSESCQVVHEESRVVRTWQMYPGRICMLHCHRYPANPGHHCTNKWGPESSACESCQATPEIVRVIRPNLCSCSSIALCTLLS